MVACSAQPVGRPRYDTATRTTALLGTGLDVVSDPQPETRLAW
jgi:hypothetical protein